MTWKIDETSIVYLQDVVYEREFARKPVPKDFERFLFAFAAGKWLSIV